MALKLFNSQSGKKEVFQPLDDTRITMYVCGPTVYNFVHIGNGLCAVVFDLLFRVLRDHYPEVVYARNITDLDDRINTAYQETGEPIARLTNRYIQTYQEDVKALGCLSPTIEPRATDYIEEMIKMIKRLLATNHAYEKEGHVLFHAPSYKDYGKLTNCSLEAAKAALGARIEQAAYKKHLADFILWKPSTEDLPGWESPWGRGRPGWHLECTAMVHSKLGTNIDIHGGGRDLKFPHHENEIAQSACLEPEAGYARYWLHNGLIRLNNSKMSKSLGNFATIRSLLEHWDGETLRYALLSGHYRSELDWSDGLLQQARSALDRLYRALQEYEPADAAAIDCPDDIRATLQDDLNTPLALSALHQRANALFQNPGASEAARLSAEIRAGGRLLGLCQNNATQRFQSANASDGDLTQEDIEALVAGRDLARRNKDFAKADEIRETLAQQGIEIEDTATGGRWRYQ